MESRLSRRSWSARRAGKSSAETAQRRPKDHQAAQSGSTAQRQGAGRNNVVAGAFKKARSLVRRGSGQRRGRLTPLKERARLIALFDEAVMGGASRYQAAAVIGISERTLKRWRSERKWNSHFHYPIYAKILENCNPTESVSFSDEKSYSPIRLTCCQLATEPLRTTVSISCLSCSLDASVIFWVRSAISG